MLKLGFIRRTALTALLTTHGLWNACIHPAQLEELRYGEIGRFEFRNAGPDRFGVVIGVPHGSAEQGAIEFAQAIRDGTGGGLVIAYGFKNQRIPVAQPLIHTTAGSWQAADSGRPGSVYPEFKRLLQSTSGGPIIFYVGVHVTEAALPLPVLEVTTSGFSFKQLRTIKHSYAGIRDRRIGDRADIARIALAINPLDDVGWSSYGVRNHGVLMLAQKGMILRIPRALSDPPLKAVYGEILSDWIRDTWTRRQDSLAKSTTVTFEPMSYGRIDSILPQSRMTGVVIAAPHGSFDWYTAELVEELSDRTILPAVVTRGFTPTECGGWRINVNRPTERRYPTDTIERKTERAREVYERFRDTVFRAAGKRLDTYIEMHQNGTEANIEVATLGISRKEALAIKHDYGAIRDRILQGMPDPTRVDLVIEPMDQLAIGAWAAKDHGMLRLSQTSLHFELPAHRLFYRNRTRRVYTKIFSELIDRFVKSRHGSN